MMHIAFRLSMPGLNSWDGKWSGDGKLYAIVKNFRSVGSQRSEADKILAKKDFGYAFGDGWFASVSAHEVSAEEAKRIKKQSAGFCGYEWMVDSIMTHGVIKP